MVDVMNKLQNIKSNWSTHSDSDWKFDKINYKILRSQYQIWN